MIEEQSDENEVETERLVVAEPGLSVFGPSSPSPRNSSETRVSQNGLPQVFFGSNNQESKSRGRATTTPQTTTSSTTAAATSTTTATAFSPTRKAIRNQIDFQSSTEDLQERIRKLKETVRKTK